MSDPRPRRSGRGLPYVPAAALASCALLASLPARLAGQEPPAPTAADREIYALAVDSAAYPDESTAILLEESSLRLEADGTFTRRYRLVRQILKEGAVDDAAELSFGYDPSREEFSLDWARVVESDGTVVSPEPVHVQEVDRPVSESAPVYGDRKLVRATLGQVDVGRIVDFRYTERTTDPPLPGDIYSSWTVTSNIPIRRARLLVDAPASTELRVQEENLDGPTRAAREDDRRILEWAYQDLEPLEPEPFAADSNGVVRRVRLAGDMEWDDIAAWYAELARNRYEVTPEMESRLAEVVDGAATLTDSLEAVYEWIAQDIRYASISLGLGGYQPRPASEVLETSVGDCKDKTTIFLALARHMGVEGYPVIVNSGSSVHPELPSVRQFNHMVAAIRPRGEWTYLDLTIPVVPYGHLFRGLQGKRGVMLRDDGSAEVVSFPIRPAEENRSSIVIQGSLDEEGSFEGTYTEEVEGGLQYRLRAEFYRPRSERRRNAVARNLATRVLEGAETDSMELFEGRDLDATPRLWAHVTADSVFEPVAGGFMVRIGLHSYGSSELIARLKEDTLRSFPIDAEDVFGLREHHTEIRFRIPEGWTADLPESVQAEGPFGFYESVYRQDGRELIVQRTMRGTDTVLPPERIDELIAWLETLAADDVDYVVLRPPDG